MESKHPLGPLKDKQAGLGKPWNRCEDRHKDSGPRKPGKLGVEGQAGKGEGAGGKNKEEANPEPLLLRSQGSDASQENLPNPAHSGLQLPAGNSGANASFPQPPGSLRRRQADKFTGPNPGAHPHRLRLSRSSGPGVTLGKTPVFTDGDILALPSRNVGAGDRALPGAGTCHQDTKVLEPGGAPPGSRPYREELGEELTARTLRQGLPSRRMFSCFPRTPTEAAGAKGGLAGLQSLVLPAPPLRLKAFKGPEL